MDRPTVNGILETALYVKDPARSAAFYRRLFAFDTLLESERLVALNVAGRSVLLLFKEGATSEAFPTPGGVIPGHGGGGVSHFAFAIDADAVSRWEAVLKAEGVAIESVVTWDGGAVSLYFRDPDGHLVELITQGFWGL